MALSAIGRKHLLEYGKQHEVAEALGIAESYVSQVVNGFGFPRTQKGWRKYRKVQRSIAARLGMTVEEAFSETERGVPETERQSSAA